MSVLDPYHRALAQHPERPFLHRYPDRVWTYADSALRIAGIVRALDELGVRRGDPVIYCVEEPVEGSLIHLACLHLGLVALPFSPRFAADVIAPLAAKLGRATTFAPPALVAPLTALGVRALPLATLAVAADDASAATELLARAAAARTPDDVYMLQSTSGTTGAFKLAVRLDAPFLQIAGYHADAMARSPGPHRVALAQPMTHGPGHYALCTTLQMGATAVVPTAIDAATPLAELRALDPTVLIGPVRFYRALYRQYIDQGGEASGRWLGPSAEMLVQGAGIPDVEIFRLAQRQGVDVVECYGMSETGFIAFTERGDWREGFVGRVLPEVEVRIADDGELLVRTPWLMREYFGEPELTRRAYSDGYFHTADYCEITSGGYLRYVGRKKDILNIEGGTTVHPVKIEQLLEQSGWVQQAVLIGDQQPFVAALLVTGDVDYNRARAHLAELNARLEPFERIRRFALLTEPFDASLYRVVGLGKVARDRTGIVLRYRATIEALYALDVSPAFCVT